MMPPPPRSPLFPYTTLFRSLARSDGGERRVVAVVGPSLHAGHGRASVRAHRPDRSEEHTSELQSRLHLVCRLLLEKKKAIHTYVDVTSRLDQTRAVSAVARA